MPSAINFLNTFNRWNTEKLQFVSLFSITKLDAYTLQFYNEKLSSY